ncbi:MAG: Appr-1-p processing protein, partial [Chromatiaceae bacterium]|nr:Appr-1-p processing protein [Chromatiaceae bacterium]
GSYLHCDKRLADAEPQDVIWFNEAKRDYVTTYLCGAEIAPYRTAFDQTVALIDGFESPLGMGLLATVDWLLAREGCAATVQGIQAGLDRWPGGADAGQRKRRLFDERLIRLALERLSSLEAPQLQA